MTEQALPRNTSFSLQAPGLQVAWDSTSLGLLKECPRKYEYSMIDGYISRGDNIHLLFGSHYHKALERYDHARAAGADHEQATIAATRCALEISGTRAADGSWRPWVSDDSNKNRFTLVRSVIWYLEQFADDPLETIVLANGKPAVELSFRFEWDFKWETGEDAIACGHLDRVVTIGGEGAPWVLDRKTTKNTIDEHFFTYFSPDNQMSMYYTAGKVTLPKPIQGIIIDGAQIAKEFTRFKRGQTTRSDSQLQEWYDTTVYWLRTAELYAQRGFWPMNDKSCGNYGGCPFRGICSKTPEAREEWLKAGFSRRVWDPLQVRGDI